MTRFSWVLVLAACGSSAPPTTDPATGTALSKDDAVYTALFLHEIKAGVLAADEAACLTMRGRTTSDDAVLNAVRANVPTAVDNSECSGGGPQGPVLDKSGGKAARFDIGPITWMGETASISGGGAHRGGGSHETIYTMENKNGAWVVVSEKPGLQM